MCCLPEPHPSAESKQRVLPRQRCAVGHRFVAVELSVSANLTNEAADDRTITRFGIATTARTPLPGRRAVFVLSFIPYIHSYIRRSYRLSETTGGLKSASLSHNPAGPCVKSCTTPSNQHVEKERPRQTAENSAFS